MLEQLPGKILKRMSHGMVGGLSIFQVTITLLGKWPLICRSRNNKWFSFCERHSYCAELPIMFSNDKQEVVHSLKMPFLRGEETHNGCAWKCQFQCSRFQYSRKTRRRSVNTQYRETHHKCCHRFFNMLSEPFIDFSLHIK